jgi:hypothetical protein
MLPVQPAVLTLGGQLTPLVKHCVHGLHVVVVVEVVVDDVVELVVLELVVVELVVVEVVPHSDGMTQAVCCISQDWVQAKPGVQQPQPFTPPVQPFLSNIQWPDPGSHCQTQTPEQGAGVVVVLRHGLGGGGMQAVKQGVATCVPHSPQSMLGASQPQPKLQGGHP